MKNFRILILLMAAVSLFSAHVSAQQAPEGRYLRWTFSGVEGEYTLDENHHYFIREGQGPVKYLGIYEDDLVKAQKEDVQMVRDDIEMMKEDFAQGDEMGEPLTEKEKQKALKPYYKQLKDAERLLEKWTNESAYEQLWRIVDKFKPGGEAVKGSGEYALVYFDGENTWTYRYGEDGPDEGQKGEMAKVRMILDWIFIAQDDNANQ